MNTVQLVANQIEGRIIALQADGSLPAKGKRTDRAALELWIGAAIGVTAVKGENDAEAQHLLRIAGMVLVVRGYEEVRNIARAGRDADRLIEVEAEKEAYIDRTFDLGR
jgi:hypothetical protein